MCNEAVLAQWLALMKAPGLGPVGIQQLLARWGSIDALFKAPIDAWRQEGLSTAVIEALLHPSNDAIDKDLMWSQQEGHHIITWDDACYPANLREIPAPPAVIYVKGQRNALQGNAIAIIGSRKATRCAQAFAHQLADTLSQENIIIISGLAMGVDAAAHRGALHSHGRTIAVLGHGLQTIYPKSHRSLAESMVSHGALLCEYGVGVSPQAYHFPHRNRLISGLSKAVVVVEATRQSGSMITVNHALDQGREVFAVPGSLGNPAASGCHFLIKQGAQLIESASDILEALGWSNTEQAAFCSQKDQVGSSRLGLDCWQWKLLECVDYKMTTLDELTHRSGCSMAEVNTALLLLELKGYITKVCGGYARVK